MKKKNDTSNNKKLFDDLFALYKKDHFKHIDKEFYGKVEKDFYTMYGYKYGMYINYAIKKFIMNYFDIPYSKIIRKSDSGVKIYLIPTRNKNHYYFIHIEGIYLRNITKVNAFKLSYLINGQILKGALKGSKSDMEIMDKFKKEFTENNIMKLVPKQNDL